MKKMEKKKFFFWPRVHRVKVKLIEFQKISAIWQTDLWKGRESPIEETSALNFDLSIDLENQKQPATHIAAMVDGQIVGVLSGHPTQDNLFRIRGLWVATACRKQGIAKLLVHNMEIHAQRFGKLKLWTLPRMTSWTAYEKMGFRISHEAKGFEFGPHFVAEKIIQAHSL